MLVMPIFFERTRKLCMLKGRGALWWPSTPLSVSAAVALPPSARQRSSECACTRCEGGGAGAGGRRTGLRRCWASRCRCGARAGRVRTDGSCHHWRMILCSVAVYIICPKCECDGAGAGVSPGGPCVVRDKGDSMRGMRQKRWGLCVMHRLAGFHRAGTRILCV
jgi:hypothetical protein